MEAETNEGPLNLGDRFRVEEKLGQGGNGTVYKAFDTHLHRTVAIKTVNPGSGEENGVQRLLREARAGARLDHPNIVTIHDVIEADGAVWIVMEYLAGQDLSSPEHAGRPLSRDDRFRILIEMLDGLHYAHEKGVVHRDIKPRNVHVLGGVSPRILDFGVAHIQGTETLTETGTMTGTVHYASPEQLQGQKTDRRTDIYSAGILAYELLTGSRPFEGDSIGAVVTKVLHDPLPPRPDELQGAERVIRKATAKDREERYSNARSMMNALRAVRQREGMAESRTRATRAETPPAEAASTEAGDAGASEPRTETQATERTRIQDTRERRSPGRRGLLAAAAVATLVAGALLNLQWREGEARDRERSDPRPAATDILLATTTPPAPEEAATVDVGNSDEATGRPTERPGTKPAERTGTETVERTEPPEETPTPVPDPIESARILYYASSGAGARPNGEGRPVNAGIRYRVLQEGPDGDAVEVDPTTVFRSGDRVRFAFEPNIDGFLYIVQRGSTDRWSILLPHPEINGGRNAVRAHQEVTIPPEGWFRFDDNAGTEHLFVYLSRTPIEDMPGGTEEVVRPETTDEHTVSVLAGSVRSRDLVFEKPGPAAPDEQAAYIVNQGRTEGPVAWNVRLEHR